MIEWRFNKVIFKDSLRSIVNEKDAELIIFYYYSCLMLNSLLYFEDLKVIYFGTSKSQGA
jgi:hypothetical protein